MSGTTVDPSASAQEGAPGICRSWAMTAAQAERFFLLSERIDARRYHHDFDTAPCMISGVLGSDGRAWKFSINGAAKAVLRNGNDTHYVGCMASECSELVMWEYTPPDAD